MSGINREPQLRVGEPRIYFGEATDTYVITGTDTDEFDYPLDAEGGVQRGRDDLLARLDRGGRRQLLQPPPLRHPLRRPQPADQQPADATTRRSSSARHRRARPELAPFLAYDRDPYVVSAGDRLRMGLGPHGHRPLPERAAAARGEPLRRANYIRNSVKVVMDAYDGTVRFVQPDEPIAAAYARIFPGLFEPASSMPDELVEHLRYPEDLFTAQNEIYRLYHLTADDGGARPTTTRTTGGRSPRTSRPAPASRWSRTT